MYSIGGFTLDGDKIVPYLNIDEITISDLFEQEKQWKQVVLISPWPYLIKSSAIAFKDHILIFGGAKKNSNFNTRECYFFTPDPNQSYITQRIPDITIPHEFDIPIDPHLKIAHSSRMMTGFTVSASSPFTSSNSQVQSGSISSFSRLKNLNLLTPKTYKLFFVGETNEGYPIIYTYAFLLLFYIYPFILVETSHVVKFWILNL